MLSLSFHCDSQYRDMLTKVITPFVLAVLLFYAHRWWTNYHLTSSVAEYGKRAAERPDVVSDHIKQFNKPEVVKVTENIYLAIGFTLANSIMLVGPDGLVIIDTTESLSGARKIFAEFRKISKKPVKAVIYTHNHPDHVQGTQAFLSDSKDPNSVQIWSYHNLEDAVFQYRLISKIYYTRAMRQFGTYIDQTGMTSGIGYRLDYKSEYSPILSPNKFLFEKRSSFNIAGLDLELIHIPGETDDQIAVYWPQEKAVFCADDVYQAFPNLYAIRGTPFRSLDLWKDSVDIMRALKPEYLVPSHSRPITGASTIFSILTDYRDAIQIVHDQTVRYMNKHLHPDEIAQRISLPEKLRNSPYLYEVYGTIPWSSKGLFSGYLGWFSGEASELNPLPPKEHGKRLVELGGGIDKVLEVAETSLNADDAQWALELATAVLHVDATNFKGKEIRAKSLVNLAHKQTSMNGKNYYLTSAGETVGNIKISMTKELITGAVRHLKMKDLFKIMSTLVNAEACSEVDKVVHFRFPDTRTDISFHMRNGLWDLSGQLTRPADVNVTVNSVTWRDIVGGEKFALLSALSSELQVEPGLMALKEVTDCLDKSD